MTDKKARLLLVEDEEHLAFTLEFNLSQEGFDVTVASTLASAREALQGTFDILLLDVMLPDGLGFDLCREIRRDGDVTPIIFLTAKGSPDDIVKGLEAGADDYVTKPFQLKELLARITAMMRRIQWQSDVDVPQDIQRYTFQDNVIDFESHKVTVSGVPTELTALELKLLHFFIQHADKVVSRQKILEEVWQVSSNVNTRTVDNFLVRLRRIFEKDAKHPAHFLTVRGAGYRFVPNPAPETQ